MSIEHGTADSATVTPCRRQSNSKRATPVVVIDGIPVYPIFGSASGLNADEFISWATKHHGNGWPMLPIGREVPGKPPGKVPWLTGQIGYDGTDADAGEFDTWPDRIAARIAGGISGVLNLGARMPVGVLGIDVDAYDGRRGLVTLAQREARWGALPDTYRITARPYSGGSGIRLYRVADDYQGPGELKADDGSPGHIDLIDRVHRLAAVPPSVHHTGARYRLYGPHGDEITPGVLPCPDELPELPTAWQAGLAALVSEHGGTDDGTDHRGGWVSGELVSQAIAEWTGNKEPKHLVPLVKSVRAERLNTHNATRDKLRVAAGEARIGLYPLATAVEKMRAAMRESYEKRGQPEKFSEREFSSLVLNAVRQALKRTEDQLWMQARRNNGEHTKDYANMATTLKLVKTDSAEAADNAKETPEPIFKQFGPADWAKPVPATRFLIKRVLTSDTWGVNGGPEKSLKTHDNQAIALAVATGKNLYGCSLFPVTKSGKVLYIVGEGGQNQVFRTLHRMCKAYGVSPTDVAKDPDFPLVVVFGAAPLDSDPLRDEIKALLDHHQPDLVLMESFYNFHPDVNAANLYERGQVIDSYHKLVRAGGSDVVSLLTDHNKKGANELGLRHISMAGQAENSDSWIQRKHRRDPDVRAGEFWLTTSFNGRDWGGSTFDIDWHLGPFNHDLNAHDGQISWNVAEHKDNDGSGTQSANLIRQLVKDMVTDNPFAMIRNEIAAGISARRDDVLKEISTMITDGLLVEGKASDHGRTGRAKVIGPAPLVISRGKPSKPSAATTGNQP